MTNPILAKFRAMHAEIESLRATLEARDARIAGLLRQRRRIRLHLEAAHGLLAGPSPPEPGLAAARLALALELLPPAPLEGEEPG
ncbi:MAG: hypothetical protein ACO3DJ_19350 [Alphaproteobacteria bacterium]